MGGGGASSSIYADNNDNTDNDMVTQMSCFTSHLVGARLKNKEDCNSSRESSQNPLKNLTCCFRFEERINELCDCSLYEAFKHEQMHFSIQNMKSSHNVQLSASLLFPGMNMSQE